MRKDEGFYPRLFCLKMYFVDICRKNKEDFLTFSKLEGSFTVDFCN
jgi:hypothetical protein